MAIFIYFFQFWWFIIKLALEWWCTTALKKTSLYFFRGWKICWLYCTRLYFREKNPEKWKKLNPSDSVGSFSLLILNSQNDPCFWFLYKMKLQFCESFYAAFCKKRGVRAFCKKSCRRGKKHVSYRRARQSRKTVRNDLPQHGFSRRGGGRG